jgi:protein TonB
MPQRVEPPPAIVAPAASPSPSPIVVPAPPPPEPVAATEPPPAPPPAAVTAPVFDAAYLQNPAPAYPVVSRRLKEQGRVVLRVRVNAGGTADEVQVRSSSGSARLDESARETVMRWKFVAARRGGETVPEWVLIPISFKLEG